MSAASVETRAWLWRLKRRDGVAVAMTSHDRPLWRDGIEHRPAPGLTPSRLHQALGLSSDSVDVAGAITSTALSAADLAAGRWDGARVEIYACDWSDPAGPAPLVLAGEFGEIAVHDGGFRAEVRDAAMLDAPVVPLTAPGCRAQFGDAACGLSRERFRIAARATAVSGENISIDGIDTLPEGVFADGTLRWLEGPLTGVSAPLVASDAAGVVLLDPVAMPGVFPVAVMLTQGCDKTIETCAGRFANAVNFRGEPWLPGNDRLLQTAAGA